MENRLVIGCKSCFDEVKKQLGYTLNSEGLIRTPILVHTSHLVNDLYELFFENYSCSYCNEVLLFSHKLMEFCNDFIDVDYHIVFLNDCLQIITNDDTYSFSDLSAVETILNSLDISEKNGFPTIEDLKFFFEVAKDIDLSKWNFFIESAKIRPYHLAHQTK